HRPAQCQRLLNDLLLLLARAGGHWKHHPLAGISDKVLHLRQHAGRNIGEAVTRYAAAGGADAGKVVLSWIDVAPTTAPRLVGEIVGLDQHLEERIIPAHAQSLAMLLVIARNIAEGGTKIARALEDVMHEPAGSDAGRHHLPVREADLRQSR